MAGFDNDVVYANNADFSTAGSSGGSAANGLQLDGQLWIGSTATNAGGTHVNVARLSAGSGISITNGAGSISIATSGAIVSTLTGNSGAISPTAGNINTLGTGSITISGSGSTLTTQLTGLTNHAIQIGAGTATLTQLAAGTTGQVLQTNTGADPTWSSSTYPSTNSTGDIIYGSGTNTLSKLAIATIPGVNLEYDGTNVAWFNPLQETKQFEDWIGQSSSGTLNWRSANANSGTQVSSTGVTSGHPGTVQMGTNGTNNATSYIALNQNSAAQSIIVGGGALTVIWVVMITTLSTNAETFLVNAGMSNLQNAGATAAEGIYFSYTDTGTTPNWQIVCRTGSAGALVDSGIAVVAGTWYTLRFDVNAAGTSVAFTINGVAASGSPIVSNIPTLSINAFACLIKSNGTTARQFTLDTYYMYQKLTSAR